MTDKDKTINVDVQTASRILRISQDAVRKRIKRGSLTGKQDENGVWTVTVEDVEQDKRPDSDQTNMDVVNILREHVKTLKKENEAKQRTIDGHQRTIDGLIRDKEQINYVLVLKEQKILELEAPKEKYTLWERLFGKQGD